MFIKKIFENKQDNSVHKQFVRFGKGTYAFRAVMNVTKQADKIKLSSTYEYANDLIEFCCNLTNSLKVSGIILSKTQLPFEGRKKSGLFQYEIEQEMKSEELKKITGNSYAILLDLNAPGIEVKMKKKLPKPGKSGEGKINDKFCVAIFDVKYLNALHNEFLFDIPSVFKKVRTEHTYVINDIVIPAELKKEKDFEKVRMGALRKGKLIRKIIVDGKETIKEKEMAV